MPAATVSDILRLSERRTTMKFIGIDLAARPRNTSMCILDWITAPRVQAIHRPATDDCIVRAASNDVAAVGIDSPFGWPLPFLSFIQPGREPSRPDSLTQADSDRLKYRSTDLWVREHFRSLDKSVRPLSVATDKLGAVALRCVCLVQCLVATRRHESIFEVYPAASLANWVEFQGSYKVSSRNKRAATANRRRILDAFVDHGLDLSTFDESLMNSDDNLDALVSALTAALAVADRTHPPPPHLANLSTSEGWIQVPIGTLLDFKRVSFPESRSTP